MPGIETIQVYRIFGAEYAVIARDGGVPQPVLLSGVIPAPSYQELVAKLHQEAVEAAGTPEPGHPITIAGFRIGADADTGLPIYDLLMPDGRSVSEIALSLGYATIHPGRLDTHAYPDRLLSAMRTAREAKAGVWHEWTSVTWSQTLPISIMAKTKPMAVVPDAGALNWMGILFIIAALVFLAMRDAMNKGPRRSWLSRLGGGLIGYYSAGSYRGVSAQQLGSAIEDLAKSERKENG
jgi:hypothetical protein